MPQSDRDPPCSASRPPVAHGARYSIVMNRTVLRFTPGTEVQAVVGVRAVSADEPDFSYDDTGLRRAQGGRDIPVRPMDLHGLLVG